MNVTGLHRWLVGLLLLGCACRGPGSANYQAFDAFVEQTREVYHVPGAVVGVVRDGDIVLLKGYGVRSLGRPDRVDPDTRFQIASNTKFMAAASAGVLVDAGRAGWDQPLVELDPGFRLATPGATAQVSFRDLLAHRSGLPAYEGDLLGRLGYDTAEKFGRARYVPLGSFQDKARYSNLGFFLAGEVAARASGLGTPEWPAFVGKALFEPLGMSRSSGDKKDLQLDANYAGGHRLKDGAAIPMDLELIEFAAAGSVVSTGADMARWIRMLLSEGRHEGRSVLQPGTVAEIFKTALVTGPGGPLGEKGAGNGLGTENYTFLGTPVVTKNGAMNGVRTIVILVPSLRVGLFVLCNMNLTVFPEAVAARFLEDHIGLSGEDLQRRYLEIDQPRWTLMESPPIFPATPAPLPVPLAQLAGTYHSEIYGDFALAVDGEELSCTSLAPRAYRGRIRHWDGLQFLLQWPDPDDMLGLVVFQVDPSGATGFAGFLPDPAYMAAHHLVVVDYRAFIRR